MSGNWSDLWCELPPLGEAARQARAALAGGAAFHLAVVTHLCNHRHPGGTARSCRGCRHRDDCGREVDATLLFAAALHRERAD